MHGVVAIGAIAYGVNVRWDPSRVGTAFNSGWRIRTSHRGEDCEGAGPSQFGGGGIYRVDGGLGRSKSYQAVWMLNRNTYVFSDRDRVLDINNVPDTIFAFSRVGVLSGLIAIISERGGIELIR